MTAALLGGLALVLAGPAPWLMLRLPALRRTPAATLLLWQSMALAAVLAAVGAGLSLMTLFAGAGASGEADVSPWEYLAASLALAVTVTVVVRLLISGHRVGTGLRTARRQHRDRVDLVANRDRNGVHVLEHPLPVAWCLPGMREQRIVVSEGLMATIPPEQAAAVVAHEREHLRARHDLVLEAFTVLHRAFPSWVASASALREAELLVEVLADRGAVRERPARELAGALVAVAAARGPAGSLGIAGPTSDLVVRVELLRDAGPHRLQHLLVLLAGVLLLAVPTVAVVRPWLWGLL